MRHEDGATYNPFVRPGRQGHPLGPGDDSTAAHRRRMGGLEAGLIQRARLLEQILADSYGPQELLKNGHLPAQLLFANPHFLHTCHGIQPPGNRYLNYYAADLYRGPDGRFRVLRDYSANPVGLGYALENRIVISRMFPELYHQHPDPAAGPFLSNFPQQPGAARRPAP